MSARLRACPMTPDEAAQVYRELGLLTEDHLRHLGQLPNDRRRRFTLTVWYGHRAAQVAWRDYQERVR